MKVIVALTCLVVLASAKSLSGKNTEFESFKKKFGKIYKNEIEEQFRLKIFLDNLKTIEAHNELHKAGKSTFTMGVNQFADLTTKEYAKLYNGYRRPAAAAQSNKLHKASNVAALPDTVDWRTSGCVTPVKDQGQCGSCWSFSATGSLEAQNFFASGVLNSFSEQQIMDCSWDYDNEGCNGGWMDQAFQYVIASGSELEDNYPYLARDAVCRYDAGAVVGHASSFVDIPEYDEAALQDAVANVGPVSVAIDASHASFQLYSGGVYNEALCFQNILDHGVLAVGYGNEGGKDYWLVKNSWGTSWGEDGYIKMSRNANNQCGIASVASYPVV